VIWVFPVLDSRGLIGKQIICSLKSRWIELWQILNLLFVFHNLLYVEVLAARSSDHAPLYVVLHQVSSSQRRTKSLFRYESWWQRQEGFTNAVRQVWIEKSSNRTPWGLLKGKIHRSTKVCQQWRKVHVDPID
jgi:hypothetical protein